MDDLISRQAAIKALYTEIIKRRLLDDVNDGMLDEFDTESILRRLPSAQPEIIHCKDCVHHIDGFFCRQANHHTSDKDHCASVFRAERRTDE